jgi:hypothetical protein
MPARLQIKPEDCSPLGQQILQYLETAGISMNRLAEISGIPQPRLRGACFKGTCPTPETLRKLSRAMDKHHWELYSLAYQGRLQPEPVAATDVLTDTLDVLVRDLLQLVRETNLVPPTQPPSRQQLAAALQLLGFEDPAAPSLDALRPQGQSPRRARG